ncbi:glycoside hydrolase family 43 protein [Agromyces bauzanensis]
MGERNGVVARNPILRGFNPDPSIVRVDDDYYLATSTFEWFPGVRIHHSTDLAHWEVVGHALDERNGFDLRGHPDSGGVWAPSLTYAEGEFWLAYSVIRTMDGDDKDLDNYLVTAPTPSGPWSEPIPLGSRGFDFSFFHDTDGTHWIVGVQWDHRPGHPAFGGIVLEQYLPEERRVAGSTTVLYTQPSLVEGPNLYHLGEWYHLLLAEGGTGWNHGITTARSRHRFGPYERDAVAAVLTSRDAPGTSLQKAGHGELVQLPSGEWAMVHLASRPTLHLGERYSTLGRETCIQRVEFDERGWLRLSAGGHHAQTEVGFPSMTGAVVGMPGNRDDFDGGPLDQRRWSTLRTPLDAATLNVTDRPGWLRLRGGHSTASVFEQSMIAQRVEEHHAVVETLVDAEPTGHRQAAGLIAWYDRSGWIWLQLTADDEHGRHLRVVTRDGSTRRSPAFPAPDGPVRMRLILEGPDLRFAVATPETATTSDAEPEWLELPGTYPAWTLSDDHGTRLRFTGMFVGVRAEDLDGTGWTADFDYVDARFTEATDTGTDTDTDTATAT